MSSKLPSRNFKSNLIFQNLFCISSAAFVDDGLVSPTIKYFWGLKREFLIYLDIAKASQMQESTGRSASLINVTQLGNHGPDHADANPGKLKQTIC